MPASRNPVRRLARPGVILDRSWVAPGSVLAWFCPEKPQTSRRKREENMHEGIEKENSAGIDKKHHREYSAGHYPKNQWAKTGARDGGIPYGGGA